MKAVVYDAPRQFSVRDVPVPQAGPAEVQIAVTQTGLCGTDLHIHEGEFFADFPVTPGHEVLGTVSALGEGVTGFALGDRVVVNPNIADGTCAQCRRGRPLLCEALQGIGVNRAGGFAEYVVAPAAQVFDVSGLDDDTAVTTEPTACAMHGLETLAMAPGSSALVLGAGPTGLLLAQLLKSGGAAQVTVAASSPFKLARAEALGIDHTYAMDRDDLDGDVRRLLAATDGAGYDVVVEATGATTVIERSVDLTAAGGTVLFYGVTAADATVEIKPYDVFKREITIKGSFAEISSFPATIAAQRAGRVSSDGLITHRFTLDEYADALDALRNDRTVHKIVVTP